MAEECPIAQATHLLAVALHCRKEAGGLQGCSSKHGEGSEQCRHHHRAFVTCANASTMMVVADLVKIADKRCPAEVAEYHRCKRDNPSSDCEEQDLAALRCASRSVLQSARAAHWS